MVLDSFEGTRFPLVGTMKLSPVERLPLDQRRIRRRNTTRSRRRCEPKTGWNTAIKERFKALARRGGS